MIRFVDLGFFGGGGSETTTYRKRDPEDPKLTALRNQIADSLSGVFSGENYARDYGAMKERSNKALGYYDDMASGLHDVVSTGSIPTAITDNMRKSISRDMDLSLGSSLNSLGSRGVVNSSVLNRSVNAMGDSAANAYAKNYLDAYNSVSNNYNNAMQSYAKVPGLLADSLSAQYQDPYRFWKDWQSIYSGSEDYDHVVSQGGK